MNIDFVCNICKPPHIEKTYYNAMTHQQLIHFEDKK